MNQRLASIAREEARKNYHGSSSMGMGNLFPMAELFENADGVSAERLDADWSGAFVYLCTERAGYGLPVHYPDTRVPESFAFVSGWERYARLPKIGRWHSAAELPMVGDLAVFETAPDAPGQMGIVLSVGEESFDVAMGNYRNHSAVVEKKLFCNVRGWIRL